jgi:uncharacterized protein (DUF342 family)
VAVSGDIKSGFEVKCGGDLQVNGIIEDCKVLAKGNVLCRYGFVGRGGGVIEAEGDVSLGYMKNQTVIALGNVNIAKEAINCNITARKSIKIYGHSLSAAGGTLVTAESIVLKTAGNISGVETVLRVDYAREHVEEMAKMKAAVDEHNANIKKLTDSLNAMPPAKRADKELARKLKGAAMAIKQQIAALETKMRALHIVMEKFENNFIRIDRCAYPGTVIKFGQRSMTLSDMLAGGKTIRVIDSEIRVL